MDKIIIKKVVEVEVESYDMSKTLANLGDTEQADFINDFAQELSKACENGFDLQLQYSAISTKLNVHGEWLIKQLYEFIELNEKK